MNRLAEQSQPFRVLPVGSGGKVHDPGPVQDRETNGACCKSYGRGCGRRFPSPEGRRVPFPQALAIGDGAHEAFDNPEIKGDRGPPAALDLELPR